MATTIRLARGGRKKRPFFRIVVADSRSPRDGRYIERIGTYEPLREENKCTLNQERATYWLGVGAQPSERVSKLFAQQGLEHKLLNLPSEQRLKAKEAEKEAAAKAEEERKQAEAAKAKAEAEAAKKAEQEAAAAAKAEEAAASEAGESAEEGEESAPAEG